VAFLAVFFVVPLGFLAYQSLESGNIDFGFAFTWEWSNYWNAVHDYKTQFIRSLEYAGIATLLALVFVAAAIFAAIFHVHLGNGVGDRNYVVADTQDLKHSYKLGLGDLKVDLRNVAFPTGKTEVSTRVDVGDLHVIVPNDVALRVDGDAQLGQVQMLGKTADGRNVDRHVVEAGKRVLVLKAHVGVGRVRVTRAVR